MKFHAVRNPAELALPYAETMVLKGYLDNFDNVTHEEQKELEELEKQAYAAKMLGRQYFVSSGRSVLLPADLESDEFVRFEYSNGLDFSGELVTFSTIRVGRNLGGNAMRALCLTFDNVMLMPYFEKVDNDKFVHTPAYAITDISPLRTA